MSFHQQIGRLVLNRLALSLMKFKMIRLYGIYHIIYDMGHHMTCK